MWYRICPLCGSALDPAERCECLADPEETEEEFAERMARREQQLEALRESFRNKRREKRSA